MTKRLIVAPHADDEVLGCGGLIAKYPNECHVVVLSDKGDGRLAELARAQKLLGYTQLTVGPFQTGTLTAETRALTGYLDVLVREVGPCELYLPTPGAHQDHIAAYTSGIRSARFSYTGQTWFAPTVLLYEVPSYSVDLFAIPYPWNRYELLTEAQMDLKELAIDEYESQNQGTFKPSAMARANAKQVGAQCGDGYAERYAVVRDVIA